MLNKNQLEKRLAALSPQKRELLRAKLSQRMRSPGTARLSYAQQRIWFGHQIDPDSAAYNVPFDIPYRGALDYAAVRKALDELVWRHEGLRTIFPESDNGPIQQILKPKPVVLPVVDLMALPAVIREAAAKQAADQEASRPFDLASGPLFRATLVRVEDDLTVLSCTLHHIICDGWSISVLLDEFSALYVAFAEGKEANLPAIRVQYRDFAEWQRSRSSDFFDADLDYWRKQLDGVTPVDLPPDLVRNERTIAPPGAGVGFTWPGELAARLSEFCNAESVTPFMTLVAVFQWLLSRYTEQHDITIGTDIAGRNRLETERIVGYFVNQVVLRMKFQPDWTFRELLSNVRETVLDAYAHQELPFDRLVDSLTPRREVARTPFFQAKLVVQNMPGTKRELKGFTETCWHLGNYSAKLDITVAFRVTPETISGVVEYASDLYSRGRIETLLHHFKGLLSEVVAHPEKRLRDLVLLDGEEERELLEWSRGPRRYTPNVCLHESFSDQAAQTPEAIALVTDEAKVSYADLEAQANQLAHYLRRLGVGPEVRVGIYLPRSINLFRVLLAILKAGGAYVPLDPDYPRQRLADVIEDAQLAAIVTESALEGSLPSSWAHIISLDTDREEIESEPITTPKSGVVPRNTAYVIFTSGSTGRAKGVAVPHAGVLNLALSQIEELRIAPGRTVAQFAPIAFDASVYEWTQTLLSGATLAIGSREALLPGEPLADFFDRHDVSAVTLPSSILARMPAGRLATIKTLVVAGEACPQELVERWGAGRRMHNAYGPTETSVCATISRPLEPHRRISIGTPLRNLDAYLLDEELRVVPVGVPGDLYVAGIGLAHGYLNRPATTAAAFVPNPFGGPGERLYKTGDRGRWLPDKTIEFIGRSDEQIKVHGCRVEPGEITSALMRHAGVTEAAVSLNKLNGNDSLVAYVVGDAEPAELREYLAKQLPSYMVPQRVVKLANIPLTSNGKINWKALPEPEQCEEVREHVGPRTPVEESLCNIWAEVLGREQVGVHDNFFELGGDSILSIQIASRAKQVGLTLTARDMFEHQTIAKLALSIAAPASSETEQEEVIPTHKDRSQQLSPADFPLAKLDQKRLQGVLARIERRYSQTN